MILSTISFPEFGISLDPSPVAFTIGGKEIYWYGIIIAFGFLLAVFYALGRVKEFGLTQDHILDGVFCVTPVALICARIYYCVFNWALYADNPISCLYVWEGGLAIYGGVIGAVLMTCFYTRWKKVPLWPILDLAALGFMIGQCVGRWGNFINREAHGGVTESFFRMGLEDAAGMVTYYHPTFLYESLWNLLGFVLLHFYSRKRKFDGEIFVGYLAWYGLGRAVIEGLRTDSLYIPGTGIRVSQLLAAVTCLGALGVWLWMTFVKKPDPARLHVRLLQTRQEAVENQEERGENEG